MSSGNYLTAVRHQYEIFPYPPRDAQDERRRLIATWHDSLALINHYCFAGRGDFRHGFRALVAGDGTGDSTIFLAEQLEAFGGEVVYLDISAASMKIARARAEVRGRNNIRWQHGSILDVPRLGLGLFDYINCSGVLHHLADPSAGLGALATALKPGGAMMLMVYGRIGRTAIYQLQELLRQTGGDRADAAAQVDHARRLLDGLPAGNWFHHSKTWFELDLACDAGIFDLLLHSQDRAYTVPELYHWVESCGLHITSLMSPCRAAYLPATYVSDPVLLARLSALDVRAQQAACELLAGNLARHFLYCSTSQPTVASIGDLDNVPFLYPQHSEALFDALFEHPEWPIKLSTPHGLRVLMQPRRYSLGIFQYLDGERSLCEIFELVRGDQPGGDVPDDDALLADFAPTYELLNQADLLLLRHRSLPACPTLPELQWQISQRNPPL